MPIDLQDAAERLGALVTYTPRATTTGAQPGIGSVVRTDAVWVYVRLGDDGIPTGCYPEDLEWVDAVGDAVSVEPLTADELDLDRARGVLYGRKPDLVLEIAWQMFHELKRGRAEVERLRGQLAAAQCSRCPHAAHDPAPCSHEDGSLWCPCWPGARLEIPEDDVRVEHFFSRTQPAHEGPVGVRLIHIPTGTSAESSAGKSQLANKAAALNLLRTMLSEPTG